MPKRTEVYEAIRGELYYADRIWRERSTEAGEQYVNDNDKPVEDWLMFILGYYNDAVDAAAHQAGPTPTLHVVRKLAGLAFRCMLSNGIVLRDGSFHPPTTDGFPAFHNVTYAVDLERNYQDSLGADRTDFAPRKVTGYLTMFKTYLDRAINGWTENAGNEVALDNIRKLAGIAVHCLEDHGAPLRA